MDCRNFSSWQQDDKLRGVANVHRRLLVTNTGDVSRKIKVLCHVKLEYWNAFDKQACVWLGIWYI
jgi:hypothetical protein